MTPGSRPNWTGLGFGVGFAVEVAEQEDEGERIADEHVLHPPREPTSGQDGIQSQDDASRELDLRDKDTRRR